MFLQCSTVKLNGYCSGCAIIWYEMRMRFKGPRLRLRKYHFMVSSSGFSSNRDIYVRYSRFGSGSVKKYGQ